MYYDISMLALPALCESVKCLNHTHVFKLAPPLNMLIKFFLNFPLRFLSIRHNLSSLLILRQALEILKDLIWALNLQQGSSIFLEFGPHFMIWGRLSGITRGANWVCELWNLVGVGFLKLSQYLNAVWWVGTWN